MGSRVAVVEDEKSVREMYMEMLEEHGYKPVGYEHPQLFIDDLEGNEVELVLLDYSMPDIKGDEVVRKMMEMGIAEYTPILIVSGLLDDTLDISREELDGCLSISYMKKPCKLSWLMETIKTLLKLRFYYKAYAER